MWIALFVSLNAAFGFIQPPSLTSTIHYLNPIPACAATRISISAVLNTLGVRWNRCGVRGDGPCYLGIDTATDIFDVNTHQLLGSTTSMVGARILLSEDEIASQTRTIEWSTVALIGVGSVLLLALLYIVPTYITGGITTTATAIRRQRERGKMDVTGSGATDYAMDEEAGVPLKTIPTAASPWAHDWRQVIPVVEPPPSLSPSLSSFKLTLAHPSKFTF